MCAKFVQVGNHAVNMDLVVQVYIVSDNVVKLWFDEADGIVLEGEDAERFLAWWYNKAEVYRA